MDYPVWTSSSICCWCRVFEIDRILNSPTCTQLAIASGEVELRFESHVTTKICHFNCDYLYIQSLAVREFYHFTLVTKLWYGHNQQHASYLPVGSFSLSGPLSYLCSLNTPAYYRFNRSNSQKVKWSISWQCECFHLNKSLPAKTG
jgi:hypothetical protein